MEFKRTPDERFESLAGHFLQQEQPGQCVQAILDLTGGAS